MGDQATGEFVITYSINNDINPLFVNSENEDFTLQPTSPCIDTGDPNSELDPDGTRADMGAFYYDQIENPIASGCTDELACNYDENAIQDDGSCSYIEEGACDCDGNVLDACGISGTDLDEDGICDDVDECVGTYDECGICNGDFNDFDSYGIESLIGTYTFYQDWSCDTLGDPEQMNGFLYIYENGIVRLDVQNTL